MTDHPACPDEEPNDPAESKPRRHLLKLLRRSDTPLDVYELAAATGLHITTVRFHLDVLARADRITVQRAPRTTPGRPRTVYTARTEEASRDGYRPLAALLAANFGLTSSIRRRHAEKAGRDWAASLIPPTRAVDADDAARRITDLLAEMNFDPELGDPTPGTGDREIRLRACPYRDVAGDHPEVVCSIHLGFLRGALARLGNQPTTVRLQPFVAPHLCLAYLTPDDQPGIATPLPAAGERRGA